MKHLGNDLAHISFAIIILSLPGLGILGYCFAGFLIGLLMELKEENSNIFKSRLQDLSSRDILGYLAGGLIIGVVKEIFK